MHELFSFFIRWSKWFVFVFFVALSCALLFSGNPYQHHVYLTSANSVASGIYNMRNSVASYFDLREINEDLNLRNAALESEVLALREQIREADARIQTDTMRLPGVLAQYNFVVAHVISNSIARPHNYITINKGTADGIAPEMGVIDHNGVVGIVNVAGPHSARIISLLNPHFKLSCKIKGSEHFGSLVWDGNDPTVALLEELPRHTVFAPGDTIVTSGYSAVFPEGIPVGYVMEDQRRHDENFFTLRVKLSTDFTTLSNVQVVVDSLRAEHIALQAYDTDKQ
ncbi:MAG: rod shape-determining protein MreC [Bacteroides sp.]|nr:rod shape-determining protein MreC [Bacteroides sp.]MCM1458001.1 rod shape-determining protein MreC [Lachnoclostridium sp.]